eukprot:gene2190-2508_t
MKAAAAAAAHSRLGLSQVHFGMAQARGARPYMEDPRKLHLLLAAHPALRLYRGELGPPAVVRQEEAA